MTADRAERRRREAEARYPAPNRNAAIDGARVSADQRGSGPDVVLIHGASGSSRDFTFQLAELIAREGFRVTSFDRPGMGWSDDIDESVSPLVQADHMIKAGNQMGIRNPIVLGHSYGGAVALAWALVTREKIRGLVSLSGASHPWPGGIGAWYAVTASAFGQGVIAPTVAAYAGRNAAEGVVADIFAPLPVPAGYVDHVGIELSTRQVAFATNARQVAGLKPYLERMQPEYRRITMPVEIIFGTADTIVPAEIHGAALARDVGHANLTLIEGAGHMPHHSHPQTVIEALRRIDRAA